MKLPGGQALYPAEALFEKKKALTDLLNDGQMEKALLLAGQEHIRLDRADLVPIIEGLAEQALDTRRNGSLGDWRRLDRLRHALTAWHDYGPEPGKMLLEVDLPEGYQGKILLVSISGGVFQGMVCLRSGDLWHREILRNTEKEISDLGFHSTRVFPLGGAYARFMEDGSLLIWGSSDDYGSCDKDLAVALIGQIYPGISIKTE